MFNHFLQGFFVFRIVWSYRLFSLTRNRRVVKKRGGLKKKCLLLLRSSFAVTRIWLIWLDLFLARVNREEKCHADWTNRHILEKWTVKKNKPKLSVSSLLIKTLWFDKRKQQHILIVWKVIDLLKAIGKVMVIKDCQKKLNVTVKCYLPRFDFFWTTFQGTLKNYLIIARRFW